MTSMKGLAQAAGLFFFVLCAGCATYQNKVGPAREDMRWGRHEAAIEALGKLAAEPSSDRLVYLLDYATALQAAGRFEESNKVFLEADRLSEELDYHSVSKVAGSLLFSEEVKQYKGDTFEKIFINAQLALNFLALSRLDDALVEARRINEKYLKLRAEDKKEFELNPFAKYLSALIWEADGKFDDAAIAFTDTYKLAPEIPGLDEDLLRATKKARRTQEYKKWKELFPRTSEDPAVLDRKRGELIVIVQQGWGPRKMPSRVDPTFPELRRVPSQADFARVRIRGAGVDETERTRRVYDVSEAAIKTLADDRLALFGRRVGGVVAKEIAAEELRKKDELLGLLAWIFMHVSDRADVRQWSTLPESIQLSRHSLPAGVYTVEVAGIDHADQAIEDFAPREIEIKPGQTRFVIQRLLK